MVVMVIMPAVMLQLTMEMLLVMTAATRERKRTTFGHSHDERHARRIKKRSRQALVRGIALWYDTNKKPQHHKFQNNW